MPSAEICLNNMYFKRSLRRAFIFLGGNNLLINDFHVLFTVLFVFSVAFVNGMTDAPNAIVSCVSTKSVSLKKAVLIAAISDFAGSVTVGLLNGSVAETVINIANLGEDKQTAIIGLSASMLSVVVWAVSAWLFGIPTSESHALIAALAGAGIAVNNGISGISIDAWKKVIYGLLISVFLGFMSGFVISKLTVKFFSAKKNADMIFKKSQVFSSAFMSFMHGAQDSQKFTGILMLVLFFSGYSEKESVPVWLLMLCPLFIAAGTATGGERIIKSVGTDMLKMRKDQGFSADIAGSLCLLISTLMGMPVSTTHTKTASVIGVGVAENVKSLDWKVAGEMIAAWLITFPACGLLGWLITKIFC